MAQARVGDTFWFASAYGCYFFHLPEAEERAGYNEQKRVVQAGSIRKPVLLVLILIHSWLF